MRALLLLVVTLGFINPAMGDKANWLQRQTIRLHDQQVEGNKYCHVEHKHYKEAEGQTKSVAEKTAIGYWNGFTAWEYGMAWGDWSLASDRTVNCAQLEKPKVWLCKISGRPCRLLKNNRK